MSVGNISVGGTGKSPFVMQLAALALERQLSVCVLSRGYMRRFRKLKIVPPFSPVPSVGEIGDEPRMIKNRVPGISMLVHKDRAKMAHRHWQELGKPKIVIFDDGFQHWRACRDFDVVMIDVTESLDQRILPLGRLRERVQALRRADLVVLTRAKMVTAEALESMREKIKRIVQRKVQSPWKRMTKIRIPTEVVAMDYQIAGFRTKDNQTLSNLPEREYILMAGIAKPESFRATVQSLEIKVSEELYFPDHHSLRRKDIELIKKKARQTNVAFLISEKDWSRWDELLQPLDMEFYVVLVKLLPLPEDQKSYHAVLEEVLRCSI